MKRALGERVLQDIRNEARPVRTGKDRQYEPRHLEGLRDRVG